MTDRVRFALVHAPGLRLFANARLSPFAARVNGVVLVATFAGVAAAAALSTHPVRDAVIAFLCGHFLWSAILAALALRGHVGPRS